MRYIEVSERATLLGENWRETNMKRRAFLKTITTVSSVSWLPGSAASPAGSREGPLDRFKLGSISDEWSQDLEEALKGMKGYGLRWVEVRNLWNIYNTEASAEQVRRMKDLLAGYAFKLSVLDTAFYKCALPGTKPVSGDKDVYPYPEQMDLLKRGIERAHALGTDKVRVFAFWRVADPEKYFSRISEELSKAAEVAKAEGARLVLENESSCNVATGGELAHILKLVPADNLGANWDVGNGTWQGEVSFPAGYGALPKSRIWHMHLKDVRCGAGLTNCQTAVVGTGELDLLGQFRALLRDGYQGTMSLEPEYETASLSHGAATRRSLEGLLKIMTAALA
ncbi:MAG: sugar phosphate isomerase [Acidobacteria bacterium]|nr:MAG: sugar phosphate isomerase [Acidobacteriota bacterium]